MVYSNSLLEQISAGYLVLLGLLFTGYMVVAVRQYGRWLNDNYADLENKKAFDEYHRRFASQEFQGCEHLDALTHRHVGVSIAMEEEDRRVNLVGIKQRTLVYI